MLLHDVILTSFNVYLFTVSVNLIYVKFWGLATKIRLWSKTSMIWKRTVTKINESFLEKVGAKLVCHAASCIVSTTDKSIVRMSWNGGWCGLEQSIFVEAIDQWRGRLWACVLAKGGRFEYSLWSDNVDFVHICYIQYDLFDCYIFDYKIMPAMFASTFLIILQYSALAGLGCSGRF